MKYTNAMIYGSINSVGLGIYFRDGRGSHVTKVFECVKCCGMYNLHIVYFWGIDRSGAAQRLLRPEL